jgi:hypothetical protein
MFHDILLLSCSAEVLDKHLSMVQRDHEQKSQIVERQIRDDAALEEAKRKEQAIKEEKIRQERARQEAEVCLLRFIDHLIVSETHESVFGCMESWGLITFLCCGS